MVLRHPLRRAVVACCLMGVVHSSVVLGQQPRGSRTSRPQRPVMTDAGASETPAKQSTYPTGSENRAERSSEVLESGLKTETKSSPDLSRATIHDIRLTSRRQFCGIVVDGQGKPLKARDVQLASNVANGVDSGVQSMQTDERGRFAFTVAKGGTYQLQTEQGVSVCRLWTADAAPPTAASSLLVVDDPMVERGQQSIREFFVADPVLMATVVAAAVVIPIVIHKSRDDAPAGS